jgi:cell division protein FtsI (penicillin-binding protein 3)
VVVGDKTFVDHPPHPTAPYPLGQILADSMNVGTIEAARAVGPAQVHAYLERFGLGRSTGIGFQGETPGSVRPLDDWWGSDAGSIPIGQGLTVNATQLAAAYNVIASGGMYRNPILVRSIESPDGTVHAVDPGPGRPVISERTASELRSMLTQVVDTGTGRPAQIDGYAVAGKTGTAWKVFEDDNGEYTYGSNGNRRYVSTFAGFAPADDPRISIVVVIDEPTIGSTTASAVAAPVFADIGAYALRALDVTPGTVVGLDTVPAGPVRAAPAAAPVVDDDVNAESAAVAGTGAAMPSQAATEPDGDSTEAAMVAGDETEAAAPAAGADGDGEEPADR